MADGLAAVERKKFQPKPIDEGKFPDESPAVADLSVVGKFMNQSPPSFAVRFALG